MGYLKYIDGIRAIAVLSVVFFHLPGSSLPINGGELGVDIFFVISGYVVTLVIYKEYSTANKIDFKSFFQRRIRRLAPSLLTVLFVVLTASLLLLTPLSLLEFAKSQLSAIFIFANLYFWRNSDYFDFEARFRPLLHTWSLSLEEQFYILFPIIFLIAKKFPKYISLRGLILISLLLSIIMWQLFLFKPQASFYLLPFRAWELLAGAYTYLLKANSPDKSSNTLAVLGFSVMIALVINPFKVLDTIGMIYYPLIVFSTCLVLAYAKNSELGKILSSKPLVSIGKRSYEIYLWHFPIFSFSYHLSLPSNYFTDLCLLLLIGFLGVFTYEFVGIRFRNHEKVANPKLLISLVLSSSLLLSSMSVLIISTKGLPDRFQKVTQGDVGQDVFYAFITDRGVPCEPAVLYNSSLVYGELKRCRQSLPPPRSPDILLLGDSTAEALFPGLVQISDNLNVGYYIQTGLPLLDNPNFSTIFQELLSNSDPGTILISSHWFGYSPLSSKQIEVFQQTINSLLKTNKNVVIIGGVPTFSIDAEKCSYKNLFGLANPSCSLSHDEVIEQNKAANVTPMQIAVSGNIHYVSLTELFCDKKKCSMTQGSKLFYRDNLHLNLIGSKIAAQKIISKLYALENVKSESNP